MEKQEFEWLQGRLNTIDDSMCEVKDHLKVLNGTVADHDKDIRAVKVMAKAVAWLGTPASTVAGWFWWKS